MTLLILAGLAAAYVGVGAWCASKDIKDSISNGLGNTRAVASVKRAFLLWPVWMYTDGLRLLFVPKIRYTRDVYKLKKKLDAETAQALKAADGEIRKLLAK